MPVGTKQLAFATLAAAGDLVLYTCPAGKRAIVKEIWVGIGAVGQTFQLYLINPAGAYVLLVEIASLERKAADRAQMWVVMESGDYLRATLSTAVGTNVLVSGTELVL